MSQADREGLAASLDRVWAEAVQAARRGDRPGTLRLRREVDTQGRRLWAVRQDRDPWVIYVNLPRAFMALRPGQRAIAILEHVRGLVSTARASASAPDGRAGSIRLCG